MDKEVTSRRAEIGRIPNGVEEDVMKKRGGGTGSNLEGMVGLASVLRKIKTWPAVRTKLFLMAPR